MIQDATDQQIKNILELFPLAGKTVLEIGCGKGRVTRDLAKFAAKVVAWDPDATAIETAKSKVRGKNVEFFHNPEGIPPLKEESIDLVVYTLSLHHVPSDKMQNSLLQAGSLLKPGGVILVLEPADGGSFNEAKSRFNVGSGDEGPLKAAALQAMQHLPGWTLNAPRQFSTEFLFEDENDFFSSKLPKFFTLPVETQKEIRAFLQQHSNQRGIVLTSERSLYQLQPEKAEN
ncbi:Methyltransferase domain-containing protein [Malonomonas rubra DSM 5091]|uniref:Methyltransferase domain-containing protein n=1 Tax=Malonomonas rubra DSM 5091 TaxID=1122189 RepID=A0A1M6EYY0_MALRU|nr:class I SAM-dependent methyltransferase [Malonomonas rubra]SHI90632.1 Methyltransferase domain-containing protein [Malonomonas rubra DSM 5091]